jgi:hypothetical protein
MAKHGGGAEWVGSLREDGYLGRPNTHSSVIIYRKYAG